MRMGYSPLNRGLFVDDGQGASSRRPFASSARRPIESRTYEVGHERMPIFERQVRRRLPNYGRQVRPCPLYGLAWASSTGYRLFGPCRLVHFAERQA